MTMNPSDLPDPEPVVSLERPRSPLGLRASLALLGLLLLTTVVIFAAVIAGIFFIPGAQDVVAGVLAVTLCVHALVMLAVLRWRLRRAGSGWRDIGLVRPTSRMLHLLWQIPVIFILILLVQALVFTVTGDMPEDGGGVDAVLGEVGLGLGIVAFLGVAVLTPIWEEIVFRGVIYGGLKPRLGLLAAALISASAFAIAHGVPILLPYMFTVGLAFVYLREFHRTLWAPIALHMSINTLAFSVAVTTLRA